jgi:hypothetical protein
VHPELVGRRSAGVPAPMLGLQLSCVYVDLEGSTPLLISNFREQIGKMAFTQKEKKE